MSMVTPDENAPILVEWTPRPGRQPVSQLSDAIGRGEEALRSAMDTVHKVAQQVAATISDLAGHPQQRTLNKVEVEFGLKLDAEAGAFIAKAGVESSITVKMTWKRPTDGE